MEYEIAAANCMLVCLETNDALYKWFPIILFNCRKISVSHQCMLLYLSAYTQSIKPNIRSIWNILEILKTKF